MSLFDDVKRTLPERQFSAERRYDDNAQPHPDAVSIMKFLADYDYKEMGDSMGWSFGGDGDNGENVLCALSVYFEYLDYGK